MPLLCHFHLSICRQCIRPDKFSGGTGAIQLINTHPAGDLQALQLHSHRPQRGRLEAVQERAKENESTQYDRHTIIFVSCLIDIGF